ncbi:MAG: TIGR03936 family radical SAM-associated protein [Candidatus Omnitrophica bacterium]|nr:TIGR03936 family radical SAM-associated protein [Candidatus Omnitrophota bacterium]
MKTYKLRVFYKKENISRFISHIFFCKLIERCLRRIDVPIRFSESFTPRPKISFCPPLPIPVIGINEFFEIEVLDIFDLNSFIEKTNKILPEGTEIKNCLWVEKKVPLSSIYGIYFIPLNEKVVKEKIENSGKIIEDDSKIIKVIFKMENFSHKKIFVNGLFDGIKRELVIKDE